MLCCDRVYLLMSVGIEISCAREFVSTRTVLPRITCPAPIAGPLGRQSCDSLLCAEPMGRRLTRPFCRARLRLAHRGILMDQLDRVVKEFRPLILNHQRGCSGWNTTLNKWCWAIRAYPR